MTNNSIVLSKDYVNIVVAYTAQERYIGYKNDLPWKRLLRGDKSFLSNILRPKDGQKVLLIMGRVTYETCPAYKSIDVAVVTRQEKLTGNAKPFSSLQSAIDYGKENHFAIIIFGGENIFLEALKQSYRIFCTIVNAPDILGDRRFPACDASLTNISTEVNQFLEERGVKKTWELKENNFNEDGYTYGFYTGEKVFNKK